MLFDKFKKLMLNSDIHIEDRKKILCKIPLDNLKQIRNEILLKMDLNMGYNDFLLSLLEKRIEFLEVDVELIKVLIQKLNIQELINDRVNFISSVNLLD